MKRVFFVIVALIALQVLQALPAAAGSRYSGPNGRPRMDPFKAQSEVASNYDVCRASRDLAEAWGYQRSEKSDLLASISDQMRKDQQAMKRIDEQLRTQRKKVALKRKLDVSPDEVDDDEEVSAAAPHVPIKGKSLLDQQVEHFSSLVAQSAEKMRQLCVPSYSFLSVGGNMRAEAENLFQAVQQCYTNGEIDYTELFVGYKIAQGYANPMLAATFATTRANLMVDIDNEMRQYNSVISQTYPGSNYACITKSGTLVMGNISETYSAGRLVSREVKTRNGLIEKYGISDTNQVSISVSDGFGGNGQSAFAVLDLSTPDKSYINDLKLNLSASENSNLIESGVSTSKNQLMAAATKLYFSNYADKKTLSDFMSALLISPEAREELLQSLMQ